MKKLILFLILFLSLMKCPTADAITYYYDSTSGGGVNDWEVNPANMVDGSIATFAETGGDGIFDNREDFLSNTCPGTDLGTITKVEIRAYGDDTNAVYFRFATDFDGNAGDKYDLTIGGLGWSNYADITNDDVAPSPWTWGDVQTTLGEMEGKDDANGSVKCAKVEIRVTVYLDSGIRYRKGATTYSIAYEDLDASHKLRFRKGATTVGIPLVATADGDASHIRIYDEAAVKAVAKYE